MVVVCLRPCCAQTTWAAMDGAGRCAALARCRGTIWGGSAGWPRGAKFVSTHDKSPVIPSMPPVHEL
jgi:hypothetical protein